MSLLSLMSLIQMPISRKQSPHKTAQCLWSCMTGCDANPGLNGKGKKSVYDQMCEEPCGVSAAVAVQREP